MNTTPMVFRSSLALVIALLLGGCATSVSSTPTAAVILTEQGRVLTGSPKDYPGARAPIEALLTGKNLRLVERVNDAQFIAMVEVRTSGAKKEMETVRLATLVANTGYRPGRTQVAHGSPASEGLKPLSDQVDKQYRDAVALWTKYP
ncbi:MAG: hypothetical protein NTV51_07155 [Verrucomicrobia bacterium]|nr:hypothetical protein [Verrucomicrobiota bacterium]